MRFDFGPPLSRPKACVAILRAPWKSYILSLLNDPKNSTFDAEFSMLCTPSINSPYTILKGQNHRLQMGHYNQKVLICMAASADMHGKRSHMENMYLYNTFIFSLYIRLKVLLI